MSARKTVANVLENRTNRAGNMAEREGFEPSVQVLARTKV